MFKIRYFEIEVTLCCSIMVYATNISIQFRTTKQPNMKQHMSTINEKMKNVYRCKKQMLI